MTIKRRLERLEQEIVGDPADLPKPVSVRLAELDADPSSAAYQLPPHLEAAIEAAAAHQLEEEEWAAQKGRA